MDSFEHVISEILWMRGHWVRTSAKVNLTPADKAKIGRPTSPRWELDIVAYSGRKNILTVVECKSWLDYSGVGKNRFGGSNVNANNRFKLFNDEKLRAVVFGRLIEQFAECGACRPNATVRLCLAAGKVVENDRGWLRKHFKKNGWELWDESWLREQLELMAKQGYEDQVSTVVAKLLLRRKVE